MRSHGVWPNSKTGSPYKLIACRLKPLRNLACCNFSSDLGLRSGSPSCRMKVFGARRQLSLPRRVFLPTHGRVVIRHLPHRDAVLHGANHCAEITTHTGFFDDFHDRPAIIARQPPDRLMRAVLARGPAQLALDAFVLIDMGEQVVIQIDSPSIRSSTMRKP